ncbi:MAG: MFS transporter [Acidimicrobiales bacterium]|jgi:EmrB/QacA subfamily drug resistance transporter
MSARMEVKNDHRWAVLVVLCTAALIINVDNTILNVALPTLVRELHATSSQLQWIVDSYAMVFAGLLLVSGSMADRFGRKKFFLLGLAVFGTGSIAAAFSGSVDLLIPSRALMGVGAALTIPSSLSIVNDVFRDPTQRARAIAAWGGIIGLGIAIGPIAGGLLLARFWWGSVFLVNVPIVIAALAGTLMLVPDSKNPAVDRPDPVGVVLSIAGLGLLLWAIIEGPTQGWASTDVIAAGLASLFVIGGFVAWESHSHHPMLKIGLFADRRFSIAAAAECLGVFGLLGALFVMTQFLQFDLAVSPLQAGLRILPMAGVLVVCAVLSPAAVRVIGAKWTVAAALAAVAGGLWQISAVSRGATSYGDVVPGLLLVGLGAGLLLPTATNSVVGSVPQGDSGIGSAINTMALQIGGAMGVAVVGSVLATRYQDHMGRALAGLHLPPEITHTILGSFGGALGVASGAGGATGALLAGAARAAFMSGLEVSFLVGAVVSFAGVLIALVWLPSHSSPVPHDPPSEPVIMPGPVVQTGDDRQPTITREPVGARNALG